MTKTDNKPDFLSTQKTDADMIEWFKRLEQEALEQAKAELREAEKNK